MTREVPAESLAAERCCAVKERSMWGISTKRFPMKPTSRQPTSSIKRG